MSDQPSLFLVDDDPLIRDSLAFVLRDSFNIQTAETREAARRLLLTRPVPPELALVDLGLPPAPHDPDEGFRMITELLTFNPKMKILVLSGQDSMDNVQHALTLGAVDFIPKPTDIPLLRARLQHQAMILSAERNRPRRDPGDACGLIGESSAMQALRQQIKQFADSPFSVLIEGQSGSGKELVAQCLHTQSQRHNHPCLTINCAAFNSELLGAQLFGHAKGAFTGANLAKSGFFEEAGEGTLILDEIGEMPLEMQAKLLRVLENGEYYRLGETKVRKSSARIIASTNRDLRLEAHHSRFRTDLYHRMSILTIKVPPLSERDADKLLLLEYFQAFYAEVGATFLLRDDAKILWLSYAFPGNIRELRNIVIRLGAKYPSQWVDASQVAAELELPVGAPAVAPDQAFPRNIEAQLSQPNFSLDDTLLEWERRYITVAMEQADGNLSQAARILGINRTTLYSKVQRLEKILNIKVNPSDMDHS